MKTRQTVTQGNWSVSTMTGYGINGARLNVTQWHPNSFTKNAKQRKGDADGKLFPSSDEAFAYALDHGYCKYYKD